MPAVPHQASAAHAAVAVAAAAGVTAARQALLGVWPEFASASHRSNKQVTLRGAATAAAAAAGACETDCHNAAASEPLPYVLVACTAYCQASLAVLSCIIALAHPAAH